MTVGELSAVLAWGAAAAYTVALIGFSIYLARLADTRVSARQAVPAGAQDRAAGADEVTAGDDGVVGVVATADRGSTAAASGGRGSRTASKAVGIAMATTWLGALLHLVAVVLRGVAAGRVPWANLYEFTLVGTFLAVVVFLVVQRSREVRFLGAPVIGLALLGLVLALHSFYVQADGVEPALQSLWLVIHVSVATAAVGVFTVAFAASVLQLLRDARDANSPLVVSRRWRWVDALPTSASLEALSFRLNAVGFVLWTFTLIGGSIWAEDAWGRYWGWDAKEVWTFVIWLIYAAYLHARTTRGWSGRRAAYFVIAGYLCVLANFTVVNLFFTSKHSYSGLG